MADNTHVFVIVSKNKKGSASLVDVHATHDSATAAAAELDDVMVKKMEVKSGTAPKANKAKATTNTKAKATKKKAAEPKEAVDEDEDEDEAEEKAPPVKKSTASKASKASDKDDARKQVPDGKPNALKDLKVIFTGTFEIDRDTCRATAEKYGAKVVSKLENADYVILGTKPGPNKLQTIEEHGLETLDEDAFFEMLKIGVPQDKLDRIAETAEGEPAKKKAKK